MQTRIELEKAIDLIMDSIHYKNKIINLSLDKCDGYILANDIYALFDQPPFSKSAMDGYAFLYTDSKNASKQNPARFEVIDTIFAGDYCTKEIRSGQAVRIMTGGRVPETCNCVVRFEDTNDSNHLEVYSEMKLHDNICLQGEDIKQGELLLKKGEKLDYVKIALLSGMGMESVDVYKPLDIGLCITGSEVVLPGDIKGEGQIYDYNMALLYHRLKELGNFHIERRFVEDDPQECANILKELSETCDLIITTGGVSVGQKDIMHETLDLLNANKVFWRVNLKPGTPSLFSIYNQKPVLSLSGNPFASTVVFELLGREILAYMQKDDSLKLKKEEALLQTSFPKKSRQRRFIRAIYHNGTVMIPQGMHSSNEIGTLINCNALIDVEKNSDVLHTGDKVKVWLI